MSTFIKFKDGSTVFIADICITGEILHKNVQSGHIYRNERTAVKRAIVLHRKKVTNSIRRKRRRRKIKHMRRITVVNCSSRPLIVSYIENGKLVHLVAQTGKKYKKMNKAIKNALKYVRINS